LSFYPGGAFEALLRSGNVAVESLEKKGRWDIAGFPWRLYRALRQERPDALYAFMGTANMLAAFMKIWLPGIKVIFGVRSSHIEFGSYPWLLRAAYWLECRLSRWADLIICNSHAGKAYAARHGIPAGKTVVVANGIDTAEFKPDPEGRRRLRAEWKSGEENFLVGLVGRLDPSKDHATFLRALAIVTGRRQDVRAVCIGNHAEPHKTGLVEFATALQLGDRLIWVGERDDMPAVYNALDVLVSTSLGEGFSNTIAEAMACGVPCVVTDVGDSALIVGDEGIVVPPRDPATLAAALERTLVTSTAGRRSAARRRIESLFSLDMLSANTDAALQAVLR
jgi:glycosyltransferase involved in cell wall biosynthesis